ncbi:MAG TPA: c-type cytochrome biogenesis protein CcmI [Gaiellaceae bacterium]|nr:c-type cytochrome biogenesis protein CcmI [Gaiellaceae bacterium]
MSPELLLGALLAAAAVVFVAVPFLRAKDPPEPATPPDEALARAEERDRILAELKELEFDHRTGKITDADYRALVSPLRRRAAALLPAETAKDPSEQRFSAPRVPSSRSDR